MKSVPTIAGIILAAGASERMGHPKAMLRYDDGVTLLARQTELLATAGCVEVIVVVGARAGDIRAGHMDQEVCWVVNEDWQRGQFSSLQAGLAAAVEMHCAGTIVLPVDVAGVAPATLGAIFEAASRSDRRNVVVPEYNGRGGHPIFLPPALIAHILKLDPTSPETRLDFILKETSNLVRLAVRDPHVAMNINSPGDWAREKCNNQL